MKQPRPKGRDRRTDHAMPRLRKDGVNMSIDLLEGLEHLTAEEQARVLESFEMLRPKLFDGEVRAVPGDSGSDYRIKRVGAAMSCSCIAWKMQKVAAPFRTCKHLKRFFGAEEEQARIEAAAKAAGKKLPANPYPNRRRR